MRLSLRNRLAAVFFAINLVAFGALYMYLAPGLQDRLIGDRLHELAAQAERGAGLIVPAAGSSAPISMVRREVDAASLESGARVTLLLVPHAGQTAHLSILADSSNVVIAHGAEITLPSRLPGKPFARRSQPLPPRALAARPWPRLRGP